MKTQEHPLLESMSDIPEIYTIEELKARIQFYVRNSISIESQFYKKYLKDVVIRLDPIWGDQYNVYYMGLFVMRYPFMELLKMGLNR